MKKHSMLVSQGLAILFFLNGGWCASIPQNEQPAKQQAGVYFEQFLCSSEPSLNITVGCKKGRDNQTDQKNSVLSEFKNICEHAAYLAEKICEVVEPDRKLITKTDVEVQNIFNSSVNANVKVCEDMIQVQQELGYVNGNEKSPIIHCVEACVEEKNNVSKFKPLCNFILWSWKYLKSHPKGGTSRPVEGTPVKTEKTQIAQDTLQSDGGITNEASIAEAPSAAQKSANSQNPKKVVTDRTETRPDVSKENIADNHRTGKAKQSVGSAENNPEEDNANLYPTPNSQANPPPRAGQDEADTDTVPHRKSEKISSSVKPEEEDNSNNDGGDKVNEEDDSLNESVLQNGQNTPSKAQSINPKDVEQKITKERVTAEPQREPQREPLEQQPEDDDDDEQVRTPDKEVDSGKAFNEPSDALSKYPDPKTVRVSSVDDSEDSHVFAFFVVATFVCILFYFIYLNKRKIIAMALEGKKGRHTGRRRPTTASYQKLDNKLDEVMASSPQPSKTHVIY